MTRAEKAAWALISKGAHALERNHSPETRLLGVGLTDLERLAREGAVDERFLGDLEQAVEDALQRARRSSC